jgi:hypothetical protein
MDPNDNVPCEREWSIEEREEFFASQDARTYPGLSGNPIGIAPFRPSPSISNCGDHLAKHWYPAGIFVTSIVPPEQGWPIAMYCPICKETTFLLSPWAAKPSDGDYWRMAEMCGSVEHQGKHNMKMAMKPILYHRLPGGYVDETGPHRGSPIDHQLFSHRLMFGPYDAIIEQEMTIEEAKKRYPNTPIPGEK